MLSRLATGGRRLVRRYTTTNSGGNSTGAPKPAVASPSASSGTVPVTWLAKKAQLNAGSWGTRLACLVVLGVSATAIYDQYGSWYLPVPVSPFVSLFQLSDISIPTSHCLLLTFSLLLCRKPQCQLGNVDRT